MQTTSDHTARDAAFGLLASTVAEYEAASRPAYGAPLKVALQRRSNGWFDETKLGFSRFKSFLEAARQSGLIDFEPTPGGDLRVFTPQPSDGANAAPVAVVPPRLPYVRSDIWRAFFDWRDNLHRWYDLDEERAVMLSGEAARAAHLRGRRDDRLVPIQPVSMDTQLGWMRAFADAAPAEARPVLQAVFATEKPHAAFTLAVRQTGLDRQWRRARQEHVIETIRAWMAEHGVEISLFGREPQGQSLPARQSEDDVRRIVKAAIDRMPMSELLRLSIPLDYLLP